MVNLLICGDFGYRGRVAEVIDKGEGVSLFSMFLHNIQNSDYSILNLESPVGSSKSYIQKSGPCIHSTESTIECIKKSGFNMVTLANNHFFDCGQEGVNATIQACKKYDIDYIGGGTSLEEARKVKILFLKGIKIRIINVCEQEFSLATKNHGGSNHIDLIQVYYQIQDALKREEKVIIIVHGGHEYYQYPSPRMMDVYRYFIDAGASAVINHHQHCYSGYEVYENKPIIYGLGNFCFDSARGLRNHIWNYGYAVKLSISNNSVGFDIIPYTQCNENVGITTMTNDEFKHFSESIANINKTIKDKDKIEEKFEEFVSNKNILNYFNPLFNGITAKLYSNEWFPSFISKKQRFYQLNVLQCESHMEVLLSALKSKLKIK